MLRHPPTLSVARCEHGSPTEWARRQRRSGYVSELDNWWEAWSGRLVRRLAGFSRLILFDKRGVGLADRPDSVTIEDWVEDTRTVLDAVGAQRPAVLGMSAGGKVAMVFAAKYPERTGPLILYAAAPYSLIDGTDYPANTTAEDVEVLVASIESTWGSGESLDFFARASAAIRPSAPSSGSMNGARRAPDLRVDTCAWSTASMRVASCHRSLRRRS